VYTGLYVGTDAEISEVLHVAGEKGGTGASAEYAIQDIFRFLAH
jgi:glutamate synthase domain-containing protein 2